MKYFGSNENMIRQISPETASIYYTLRLRNTNGVIYPNREQAAKKNGIDRSTLSRWLTELITKGLAEKRETGHVILISIKDAIRRANKGCLPKHRCTIGIHEHATRKEVEQEVRIKLLEEFHRQVEYKSRETKITQKQQELYGPIYNEGILEKVKSRVKIDKDGFAEISGRAIADRMGISKRSWEKLQQRLREEGRITTRHQREIIHQNGRPLIMSAAMYSMVKVDLGFASFRRGNGEVVMVKPNLVRLMTWPRQCSA